VTYLKAENQILRSRLPDRISLTEREKNRLICFAKKLGSALNELATIVHPGTIRRWIREAAGKNSALRKGKTGRPRTAQDIAKLILKLAKANSWGYTRILGELRYGDSCYAERQLYHAPKTIFKKPAGFAICFRSSFVGNQTTFSPEK
jgi:putative transposase